MQAFEKINLDLEEVISILHSKVLLLETTKVDLLSQINPFLLSEIQEKSNLDILKMSICETLKL